MKYADYIVTDARGKPVLVVEVKARCLSAEEWKPVRKQLKEYQSTASIIFGMIADLKTIEVFKLDPSYPRKTIRLRTEDVLQPYDPEFESRKTEISYFHFETLVTAWLRDLAYRWNSEPPPALKELREFELLPLMQDGDVRRSEALDRAHTLP
ncbi:MAG TPA: type I restriction enzyme HsdR N-terminal domain-containing protein [Isosphaeraceae bacterium]|nr:type I restriction enzyme HsdR N-terminal domain-containing protein [Isosphaeraceae bacterium]